MKLPGLLLLMVLASRGCVPAGGHQDVIRIVYSEETRGSRYEVVAQPGSLEVTKGGLDPGTQKRALAPGQWESLLQEVGAIGSVDLETLQTITSESAADRAAMARLEVGRASGNSQTGYFDAGNPPAPIRPLVSKLLELADSVE
ncbi:hypothetical protein [Robiginitalea sp. SC105]|uniref:hypothetical protein n=1 Tax=Robiginitalea sp. SC105 TaxID=2762332 RepID=UPI00163AFD93|nr:hypothetical protein [Robiginitalea sp. SC105]MBC2838356.1 hypothetical protein [Robiginitalea sp. SC105]